MGFPLFNESFQKVRWPLYQDRRRTAALPKRRRGAPGVAKEALGAMHLADAIESVGLFPVK
jgi:hypothetical protein